MYRFILSPATGRRVVAAGLAALALSTAACSDETTAPASAKSREIGGANAITVDGGIPQVATFVSVHIIDVTGKLVTEKATVRFRWSQPNDSVYVSDNSVQDLDPTTGIVKIAAPKAAGYEACVRFATVHFVADTEGASYPTCNSKFWLSFNFDLGNVYMRRKPVFTLRMTDTWNNLLPGGAINIYNLKGWNVTAGDGLMPWDTPLVNDGKIIINLPTASRYYYTETKAPTGQWESLGSAWYTFQADWEQKYESYIPHQQYTY